MSRVVGFSKAGGPEVLRFKNVDVPEAVPGQVRIRVKAIGLNRAESMWRENKYIEPVQFPARLGYEAVGTVDSVGKDVTTIAVGDEVNTIPSFSMNQYGMYGEVVLAPIHAVVKHPKGLSPVEAASIWMMFVSRVWRADRGCEDHVTRCRGHSRRVEQRGPCSNSDRQFRRRKVDRINSYECEAKAAHRCGREVCYRDRGRRFSQRDQRNHRR